MGDLYPERTLQCPACGWTVDMTDDFLQNLLRWVVQPHA
jgi:hypothetical protein